MKTVLILCTGNSCRSQMAEALWNQLGAGRWQASSAGTKPAGYVHPLALEALTERGLSVSGLTSKSTDYFQGQTFDLVVTVCDSAQADCPVFPAKKVLHWPFYDPARSTGSPAEQKNVFRRVRDQIACQIAEYLAESFPEKQLWPADKATRARARSICAEMHSGFSALRSHCPMNIEALLPNRGALIWRDHAGVRADVQRIVDMWTHLLQSHGGPMLFGAFTLADAYFAPVVMRLYSYALPVPTLISGYMERVQALPGVKAWVQAALAEKDFLAFEEPYRLQP
jgi:protein-tyrosine-phosphatase/glutathione S-transferase